VDVLMRVKWILLDKSLAATPWLVEQVKAHRGTFVSPTNGKIYRLPTAEEVAEAFKEAYASH